MSINQVCRKIENMNDINIQELREDNEKRIQQVPESFEDKRYKCECYVL